MYAIRTYLINISSSGTLNAITLDMANWYKKDMNELKL
ncbi:Tryptophanase leader peptide [Vibrio crassostreae]|nr:Tryptophanase leader peptide [Vibrio crassostreae]CAK3151998.1 Tryptophanase leader peptide [Vibrio crassostreae]